MSKDLELLERNDKLPSGRWSNSINEKPGAYALIHPSTESVYIGSTGNLGSRLSKHMYRLKRGSHENRNLQAVYDKDPTIAVSVAITKDREEAYDLEEALIKNFQDRHRLLNISTEDVRNSSKGVIWTEESRRRLSESVTGRVQSAESNEKRSRALIGRPKPPGFSERLSEINKNHPRREELSRALSESRRGGDNPNSKAVTIDGVVYPSGSDASRALAIPRSTLEKRLKSNDPKYASYQMGISE